MNVSSGLVPTQLHKGILDFDGTILTLRRFIQLKCSLSSVSPDKISYDRYKTSDHVSVLIPVILKDHITQGGKHICSLKVSKALQIDTTVFGLHNFSGT